MGTIDWVEEKSLFRYRKRIGEGKNKVDKQVFGKNVKEVTDKMKEVERAYTDDIKRIQRTSQKLMKSYQIKKS